MKKLDDSFTPGIYDVICARGAAAKNHPGNIDLKNKVVEAGDSYARAPSRTFRSIIVSSIVSWVRSRSPNGGFVKKMNDGAWYEVGDEMAREKVGQALRDLNHAHYKSSMKAKRRRWKEEKQQHQATSIVARPPQLQLRQPPPPPQRPPPQQEQLQVQSQPQFLPPQLPPRPQLAAIPPAMQSVPQELNRTLSADHRHEETLFQTILQRNNNLIQSSLQHVQRRWVQCGGDNADDDQLLAVFTQNNMYLLETFKQSSCAHRRQRQQQQLNQQDDYAMIF